MIVANVPSVVIRDRLHLNESLSKGGYSFWVYLYLIPFACIKTGSKRNEIFGVGVGRGGNTAHLCNLIVVLLADEGDFDGGFVG